MKTLTGLSITTLGLLLCGCMQSLIHNTDQRVYELIQDRQATALGTTGSANVGEELGLEGANERMYQFNPRPMEPELPDAFTARRPAIEELAAEEEENVLELPRGLEKEMTPDIYGADELDQVQVMGLREVLAYASKNAREVQNEMERLFAAALDLSLERHIWTPRLVADAQVGYVELSDENDESLDTVNDSVPARGYDTRASAEITQRLPYGGEVAAKVVYNLIRDVADHVQKAETGQAILSAQLPLLRGAGRSAYESRYDSERTLIYALRDYERFRRRFLLDVSRQYIDLQQRKAAIVNTYKSYLGRKEASEKADFENEKGRLDIFEASRAKANLRDTQVTLVSDKQRYATALDSFKILIGMSVRQRLEVVEQDQDVDAASLDALLPDVDRETAVRVALKYRLDLLNDADRVDDARRRVRLAQNDLLPDLDFTGSATFDSRGDQLRPGNLRDERSTWEAGLSFRIDDRRPEQRDYRQRLLDLRRAERDFDQAADNVRADVRAALRSISQQENVRVIQALNVEENDLRFQAANAQVELGRRTNQDVVDADNNLLRAKNQLARAVADYRVAILTLRLETGTLRVDENGGWTN